ncbi:hypothetical protein MHUMG1_09606 [Metarhizium humberi]|uniref:Nephrocystin 3-like N-terminal domain-containing protein n=1 Tax=Metarhizium humberi TaxID=2596975 RepID=A0A9P8M1P7_9HYPO|nr:hypothetical protein MHUMG1_09606 [Metarhizium humberi]
MLPTPSMDYLTALGVAGNQEDGDGNHGRIEDTRGAAGPVQMEELPYQVTNLSATIARLEATNKLLQVQRRQDLQRLKEDLVAAVSHCYNKELDSACHNKSAPVTSGDLQQLQLAAKHLSEAGQTTFKNQQVLEALYFRTLPSRSHQIASAHAETFKWAYSNDPKRRVKFREWLETRKDVFWIHGKPGSGKSTLMKYLYCNDETKTILQSHWERQKRLVLAKFFFWNAREPLQKSQAGTLRSLLFYILRQYPELIPAARSAMPSWPWTVFDDEFGGDGFWTLKLEDPTRGDI